MTFEIWSDNLNEADWFSQLDYRLASAVVKTIGRRDSNPSHIEDLIAYDRPDIILTLDGTPILVVEKTQEVPTGHNVGQRFARIARAAELQVPVLYFFPFDARKHGKFAGMCNVNARLLLAMKRLSEVHGVWALPVNWPADEVGTLVWDGSENNDVANLLSSLLDHQSSDNQIWRDHSVYADREYERRCAIYPKYKKLPPSVRIFATEELEREFPVRVEQLGAQCVAREKSMVYKMDMSPDKCRRQDPYTGMQFIYDYAWLRFGINPSHRNQNLFLSVPQVTVQEWLSANPEDYSTKSCNWYLIADGIILRDGFLSIESWPLAPAG